MKGKQQGFSLLELLVTLVIIGIVAAIAIPSYKQYVKKTYRVEAQSALLEMANAVERYRLHFGTYLGMANQNTLGTPTMFKTQVPFDRSPKTYNLRMTYTTTSYTLFAVPIAGGVQATDGRLKLDSLGDRKWDKDNDQSYTEDW